MNYYSHHIGDYTADAAHLSMLEDGAYRRLMDRYYTTEAPLPYDWRVVCRLVRAHTTEECDAVVAVLSEFFDLADDGWHHKRCDAEILAYKAKAEANRVNGWKGGRPRKTEKEPTDNPQKTQVVSENNPQKTLTKNQEPITNNQEPLKTKEATPPALPDLFDGIDSQVVRDFKALRTKQKAPITKTALDGIQREANKAGISLESALTMCCERGWRGFKAEWLGPRLSPAQGSTDIDAARKAANEEAKRRLFGNKNMEVFDG